MAFQKLEVVPTKGAEWWYPNRVTYTHLCTPRNVHTSEDAMQANLSTLIDKAAEAAGSDYKLAQLLGVPRQMVSDWRNGRRTCTPEDQALIAAVAGLDAEEVLIRAILEKHAGKPKGEKLMQALGNGLRRIGEGVTSVFLGSVALAFLSPGKAEAAQLVTSQTPTGNHLADTLSLLATMCRTVKLHWLDRKVKAIAIGRQPCGDLAIP